MSDIKDDGILVICLHHVKWEWKTYTEEQQQRKSSLLCRNIPTTYLYITYGECRLLSSLHATNVYQNVSGV